MTVTSEQALREFEECITRRDWQAVLERMNAHRRAGRAEALLGPVVEALLARTVQEASDCEIYIAAARLLRSCKRLDEARMFFEYARVAEGGYKTRVSDGVHFGRREVATICELMRLNPRPALNDLDTKLERHIDFQDGFFVELGGNDGYA